MLRKFTFLILVCIALLALPGSARAHANLVEATPASNESLDQAPVQIELIFSEPIEDGFSTITVLDAGGMRVDNDDARVDSNDPLRMTVSVRSLLDGVYTVSWKTLSSVDSHITVGAYPFAVGEVDADELAEAASTQQTRLSTVEVVFRWLQYLSAAAMAGVVLFRMLVWGPAVSIEEDKPRPPWRALVGLSLIVMVAANAAGLLSQVGQVLGGGFAAPWNPTTNEILFATRYGSLWLFRLAAAILYGLFALRGRHPLALAAVLGVLLNISLGSHAAAEPRPFWPVLADWIHLSAVSVWVGGLVSFAAVLRFTPALKADPVKNARITARLVPRFSRVALASVAVLGLTGVYSAVLRLGSWDALFTDLYGRTLIVKTLFVLPLVGLGALNLLGLTPRLRHEQESPGDSFPAAGILKKVVTWEVAISAAVLLVSGVFTILPPSRAAATTATHVERAAVDDLDIRFEIDPGGVGQNSFTVWLDRDGVPVTDAREVSLLFTPTTVELPAIEAVLEPVGDGAYTAEGAFLSLPDTWQVQVAVRRDGLFDAFANFEFAVGEAARAAAVPWNRIGAFLLVIAGIGYLFLSRAVTLPKHRRRLLGQVPALLLVAAGGLVFFRPAGTEERLLNPIPPNAGSIAIGRAIYQESCLSCHGPGGKGDGPVGLTLNPRPADLTLHTAPGVHPDSRLYEWITYGFPGAPMPAFEETYTNEERWHIVNYIRTFSVDQ